MNHRRFFIALAVAVGFMVPVLANAQSAGVIRVVTDSTFPPFEFFKDGKRTGFDIELMETLAKSMGKKIEWTDIDFKGLIPGLISKRFDVAASAIYVTEDRRKVVDFTDPYYPGGLVIVVKNGNNTILKPADLNGKHIAVQVGTKSVNYLKEYFPQVDRVEVEKNQEMFNLVEIGRADAAVTGKPAALEYVKARPGLKVIDKPVSVELYGFAVRKDLPEVTQALNAALKKAKLDGSYDKLVKKWLDSSAK
ncbi:amino acid ABC transporter substrate-binding protein, PAAT family [Collimonas sp. OK607]|uniref:transporter substrate-binding domain-containing protein n=1 Tax=Collimonas sp. OK607 TaxID=1798194 RepID=UPI0008E29BA5|nr:transporter substrate-binding domain-containing protein [Collimonas sp. OK607]SFB24820.1 amino acid ABC transporter substrate-binding protein, PAAT family [Collimonas sp. OK607]